MSRTPLTLPREVPEAFSANDLCRLPAPDWHDPMPRDLSAVTDAPTGCASARAGVIDSAHQ
jgi:hypothetical protein